MGVNISVVVPVFNSEKTLCRCIDSILSQTYNDYELLIINDGSTDHSVELCKKYLNSDSRVKLFSQFNKGVSSARNLGLDEASGKWICFIDSDDWVEADCFEKCFDGDIGDSDLIMFSCKWARDSRLPDKMCENVDDFMDVLPRFIDKITFVTPWCKFFKKDILDKYKIRFDSRFSSGEDTLFSFEYLTVIDKMHLLSFEGYHYVVDESDSTLSKIKNRDWESQCLYFDVISRLLDILEKKYCISLMKFRCLLGECILNKYLSTLSALSLNDIKRHISDISDNVFLHSLFTDEIFMPKGERRHLFDFLIKHRFFILLSIYIKFFKAEY